MQIQAKTVNCLANTIQGFLRQQCAQLPQCLHLGQIRETINVDTPGTLLEEFDAALIHGSNGIRQIHDQSDSTNNARLLITDDAWLREASSS